MNFNESVRWLFLELRQYGCACVMNRSSEHKACTIFGMLSLRVDLCIFYTCGCLCIKNNWNTRPRFLRGELCVERKFEAWGRNIFTCQIFQRFQCVCNINGFYFSFKLSDIVHHIIVLSENSMAILKISINFFNTGSKGC